MFAKRLIHKVTHHYNRLPQHKPDGCLTAADLDLRIALHYGIPSTASVLAFDPIQRLLAIGTLDGRIKVIGGENIEGLLVSPKQLPFKYLEFLHNQGILIGILNDNVIQVWSLESRCITCSLQWESNITACSVICGSSFIYVGDEYGLMSVLKYEAESGEVLQLPYRISANSLWEAAGFLLPNHHPIVGVLPQPCSAGNRVLIAYANGLIILWDVVVARIVVVRGDKVLQLKTSVSDSLNTAETGLPDDSSDYLLEEKEISTLCWASSNGSILAVGYIDGDILFWKTTIPSVRGQQVGVSSNNVVNLQLSSTERRLPIIVLHWCPNNKPQNDGDGQLFIYGGDEIGSEEVLTVLNLEWSSGMETLRCVGRFDVTLMGSFADMTLLPAAGVTQRNFSAVLCVLTSPGHLQIFDGASLSASVSQKEKKTCPSTMEFPVVIPTVNPSITVAELFLLYTGANLARSMPKIAALKKCFSTQNLPRGTKGLLTGGVLNHLASSDDKRIERLYVAGYQDGSVRMWDATCPVLSLICMFEGQVQHIKMARLRASVSKLAFCFVTLSLAVGDECGLVRLYDLSGSCETNIHSITETEHEVINVPISQGPYCKAVFDLLISPVQMLDFSNHGTKLLVGYECGRVAVLDMTALSVLFLEDCVSGPSSSVISVSWKEFMHSNGHAKSPKLPGLQNEENHAEELCFILTKDAKVYVFSKEAGNLINSQPMALKKEATAISVYIIEGNSAVSGEINKKLVQLSSKNEPSQDVTASRNNENESENQPSSENTNHGESLMDSLVLLCCKDALRLYPLKSVLQGDNRSICKVKLTKPCYWTTTLMKHERVIGLVLFYQIGAMEIRCLPDLAVVKEASLTSILRWNFKVNMDSNRTISSANDGHVTLANGCEMAFISLLAESLPCLHDKVLAAAAEVAIDFSSNQKKQQGTCPNILGGIFKGFKEGKINRALELVGCSKSIYSHLEDIFSKEPFAAVSSTTADNLEATELSIDDIKIDEPVSTASTSHHDVHNKDRDKRSERERLFDGEGADVKPRLRTREEIIATYRKAGDASSAAGQAKKKLLERQEKLERISKRTEELQNGAQDFASLANELVKAMEGRKWWHI